MVSAICEALTDQFGANQPTVFMGDEATGCIHKVVLKCSQSEKAPESMISLARHALTSAEWSGQSSVAFPGVSPDDDVIVAVPLVIMA